MREVENDLRIMRQHVSWTGIGRGGKGKAAHKRSSPEGGRGRCPRMGRSGREFRSQHVLLEMAPRARGRIRVRETWRSMSWSIEKSIPGAEHATQEEAKEEQLRMGSTHAEETKSVA